MQKITEAENQSQNNDASEHINEDEQSYAKSTVGKDVKREDAEQKVLGLIWNTHNDTLVVKLSQ